MQTDLLIGRLLEEDIASFIQLRRALAVESDFMLPTTGELSDTEQLTSQTKSLIANADVALFISRQESLICGFLLLRRDNPVKVKHRASLVMGVMKAVQGRGVARELVNAGIQWAAENAVRRIELTVVKENVRAIRFYEKCGFVTEGVRRDAIFAQHRYFDELYMARICSP